MRIAELLTAIASWLESKDNEALLLAEYDEACMDKVAASCVEAAEVLKKCADEVDLMEDKRRLLVADAKQLLETLSATPLDKHLLTVSLFDGEEMLGEITASSEVALEQLKDIEAPEDITATISIAADMVEAEAFAKVAKIAGVFDCSEDESLKKQAAVIDELLLTLAAPPHWIKNFKQAQSKKLEELTRLYQEPNKELHEVIGVEEAKAAIAKSEYNKEYRACEMPLSTRTCPDHYSPMARIGEGKWQCQLDKRVYDFNAGFKTERGNIVPPGGPAAISQQNKFYTQDHTIFDTRESKLQKNQY